MSVYQPKGSPFYHFDFWLSRRRFFGSTGRTIRREAEAVEKGEREKAKEGLRRGATPAAAMTLDIAAGRFWAEVGQHHVNSPTTWRDIERLNGYLGKDKLLSDITDDDVARLVAWRRGHRLHGRAKDKAGAPVRLVQASTVNRSTVQLLQAIFARAKRAWGGRFDREPDWRHHRLPEPQERVRELADAEAAALEEATRADYGPFLEFARASGLRLRECLLRWPEVDFATGQITKQGKQARRIVVPITPAVRRILWPLRGHHSEFVFTYIAAKTRRPTIKGRRYPITYSGAKTMWRRLRAVAGVVGFRFHDFRHDLATKLLRETGNLKIVQKALNHASITTTTKYSHVLDGEVAEALARVQKSRIKSRNRPRRTG